VPSRVILLEKTTTVPALALIVGLELDRQAYMEDAFDSQAAFRVISTTDVEQAIRTAAAALPQVIICIQSDGVSALSIELLRQNPDLADIPVRFANAATWSTVLTDTLAEVSLSSETKRSKTMPSYPPGPASSRQELVKFAKNPLAYFQGLAATYGSFAYVRLGPRDTYLISGPESLHTVLVEQADRFEKPSHTRDSFTTFMGEGLIVLSGPKHKQHRRMIQPTLSRSRVERYGPTMVEYARRMVDTWQVGETRDIAADLMRLALNVVGTTVFGVPDLAENHALFEATAVAQRYGNDTLIHGKAVSVSDAERQRALNLLDALVADVLKPRQTSDHDLIALLKNAADPESGQRLTDQEIRDEALTLLLAGHETTANALAWTFYLLAKHAHEEARLSAEIDRGVGARAAAITDLPNLPYTNRVIQESLRLYPPAWFFGRTPVEPVEVLGYTILPGASIVVCPYAIHRNPEHFPAPETFNPDRFISEPPRYAYLPFGIGPRMCVGQSLALQEMALVLATVLQRVHLSVPEEYIAEPEPMLTLRPRNGLKMTVSSRKVGEQVS
jgi:cytochrome P450